jgi:hypothetical protein
MALLLRNAPPPCFVPVLSSLRVSRLEFSCLQPAAYITLRLPDCNDKTTGSRVPHQSLCQARAASVPDAIWTVNRFPPDLSRANDTLPVLTSLIRFRHFFDGSLAFTFLTLPDTFVRAFSVTLTTSALYRRSLRWFEASSCKAVSEGLPPSLVRHCSGFDFFLHYFRLLLHSRHTIIRIALKQKGWVLALHPDIESIV